VKRAFDMPFGAAWTGAGTRFRLWAPGARTVELELQGGRTRVPMERAEDGFVELRLTDVRPGDRYAYRIDGEITVPDPASRYQPEDVHGPSELIDPASFDWSDDAWRGRPWEEAVIYELHVGSFTEEGSFAGIERRLGHLAELGATVIELMPLSEFPGRRNWGYDGAFLFAPDSAYGRPEDLKRLVQAAHRRGLMVMLDVVYNHFGPEGNYLGRYAPPFFDQSRHTPWGAAINFDREGSAAVRAFFIANALYWLTEFNMDGLRFDAVHAILDGSSPDILEEIATTVRARLGADRHIHLVLENDHNAARYLRRERDGRPGLYTAQWNDDYHHAMHVMLTGEGGGYYGDYARGAVRHLVRTLTEGFAYQGEPSRFRKDAPRGEASAGLPSTAFVNFLQNHDQIGNRAFGERLSALCAPNAAAAAVSALLLAPHVPLLFMGEEWDAPEPFPFFCDFSGELADLVREGRRREFAEFPAFADPQLRARIPDPIAPATFQSAVLDWRRQDEPRHRDRLELYRRLLGTRRREIAPRLGGMSNPAATVEEMGERHFSVRWRLGDGSTLALDANLSGDAVSGIPARRRNGRLLHESEPGLAASLAAGTMPPWSVLWTIADPSR
jgi:maltooligosyltrehalose trehalohydrolase